MDGRTQRGIAPTPDQESASRMTEAQPQAAPKAGPAMKVESVTIRPTENGGYIVSCSKSPAKNSGNSSIGPGYQSKDYAFSSLDDVIGYVEQEFSGDTTDAAPGDPGGAQTMADDESGADL